jgi:hypothetical protein
MPLNYNDLMAQYTQGFAQATPGQPYQPQAPQFGLLGGVSGGDWRSAAPQDFNAMAQGLLGGVYQPPTRSVDFRMFPAQPLPAPAPAAPGGGLPNGVGGTVAPVGNPINAADNYVLPGMGQAPTSPNNGGDAGDVYLSPIELVGIGGPSPISGLPSGPIGGGPSGIGSIDWNPGNSFVTQPGDGGMPMPIDAYAPVAGAPDYSTGDSSLTPLTPPDFATGPTAPPVAAPVASDPSYLQQIGAGLGSAWDYLSTNGGNVYDPARAAVDPAYAAAWSNVAAYHQAINGASSGATPGFGQLSGGGAGGIIWGAGAPGGSNGWGGDMNGNGTNDGGLVADIGGGLQNGNMVADPYYGALRFARTQSLL